MLNSSTQVAVYLVVLAMMATGIIYFVAATQEVNEASAEVAQAEPSEESRESITDSDESKTTSSEFMGLPLEAEVQTTLFSLSGAAYVPVGLWMLEKKHRSKRPYVIAIAGSASLIGLYVASRTISLPIVGLQDDVGTIDILSKVLQGAIIAGCGYLLISFKRQVKVNPTA